MNIEEQLKQLLNEINSLMYQVFQNEKQNETLKDRLSYIRGQYDALVTVNNAIIEHQKSLQQQQKQPENQ